MNPLPRQDRISQGPPTQEAYERLVDELATIRMRKVQSYGEARYEDPDKDHQRTINYADIHRKYIRLKELMYRQSVATDGEGLRDTLLDLANYCLMSVQTLGAVPDLEPLVVQGTSSSDEEVQRQISALIASPPPEFLIDQVAFATREGGKLRGLLNEIFGVAEITWSQDTVIAEGTVFGSETKNQAHLAFNYGIMKHGLEFEVLEPDVHAEYWVNSAINLSPQGCVLSHLGIHVTDIDSHVERLQELGYSIVQDVRTLSHENPAVPSDRRYRYVIFGTRDVLGFDVKLIQRLTVS